MKFPTVCIDDFYKDPESVRNLALAQNFNITSTEWPGKRSESLSKIDREFFDRFCKKLMYIFYDHAPGKIGWDVHSTFQIVEPYHSEEFSPKNAGWIHFDKDCDFAGIIYLTPEVNKNSGTSLYKLINPNLINLTGTKHKFYGFGLDSNYDESITEHNSAFEETATFYNYYNRMICFDSSIAHGVKTFWTDGEPRLTQVFFVKEIARPDQPPIQRSITYSGL